MYIIRKNDEQVDRTKSIADALVVRDTIREFYPDSLVTVRKDDD